MRNEVKVGILSLVTILVSVFGYKYLKGSNILERANTYYIRFHDIAQMDASAPVLIRGYKIGSVTKIGLDPESPDWILVTIEVKREISLPKTTKAILTSQGLMGGKALILDYPAFCTEDCLENKSFIPGEIAGMLSSMFSKDELKDYANTLGKELNQMLDTAGTNQKTQLAGTVKNLHTILDNLAQSTHRLNTVLANSSSGFEHTMKNLDVLTTAMAQNSQALSNSIKSLDKLSSGIAAAEPGKLIKTADLTLSESQKTIHQLTEAVAESKKTLDQLNGVLKDIHQGKGSLGKLINDPALYDNLNRSSKNLDLLLQDLRLNPKRYVQISVFGKDGTPYEKPKQDPAEK